MIIKILVENTAISEDFSSEHGLSLYIKTEKHNILFDVGTGELFLENARKLNIDISHIDYLIISHGHYDHGGGLDKFLNVNHTAQIFIHNLAFGKHFAKKNGKTEYIGLNRELRNHKQVMLTWDSFSPDLGIQLFTNTIKTGPMPVSNKGLIIEAEGRFVEDEFAHEQNLIIDEGETSILVTGCAHNGIINIVEQFYEIKRQMPDYVIGGFHLSSRAAKAGETYESNENIDKIAEYLKETGAKYFTGHCTGSYPFRRIKAIMGDKIEYISTGSEFEI